MDLTEDRVREIGLATGLVDNKVCAVDETLVWAAFRVSAPGSSKSSEEILENNVRNS